MLGVIQSTPPPGVPVDVEWSGEGMLVAEVAGLWHQLAARGVPTPTDDQVGYELGPQAWQAELAWEPQQAAVIAPGQEASDCIAAYRADGWDARLPDDWPPDELATRIVKGAP
jgi:hypothetical protein